MSYWQLFYHFIWSTKYRLPLVDPGFENNLYNLIVAKARELKGIPHAVGGMEDHIHFAVSIPPDISLANFIGQVKGYSAYCINHEFHPNEPLAWQREYGVLSFGPKNLDYVVQYIRNQRKHHSEGTTELFLERISGKSG